MGHKGTKQLIPLKSIPTKQVNPQLFLEPSAFAHHHSPAARQLAIIFEVKGVVQHGLHHYEECLRLVTQFNLESSVVTGMFLWVGNGHVPCPAHPGCCLQGSEGPDIGSNSLTPHTTIGLDFLFCLSKT